MTDRPQDDNRRQVPAKDVDDPTRDIRLPSVPGRPTPAVPPEWAGLVHTPEPPTEPAEDPVGHQSAVEPAEPTAAAPVREPMAAAPEPRSAAAPARTRITDQSTDELGDPAAAARQRTLVFAPPPSPAGAAPAVGSAPAPGRSGHLSSGHSQPGAAVRPAPPERRRSTWPWVFALLVLLALFAAAVVLAWVGGAKDGLPSFWEAAAALG
ncbi:MAG: hypothetical protein JWQ45_1455 [Blastococcus sp.]|nr:hypothetical protein [Blastococcus sp.]